MFFRGFIKENMLDEKNRVDRISFLLGMINGFAEMVACGVKPLAISPPLRPEDYTLIQAPSRRIAEEFGIQSYLEKSLLLTALQSADFTRGTWSILFYRDSAILQAYFDLKDRDAELPPSGPERTKGKQEISLDFMKLLGYPEEFIFQKLSRRKPSSPFLFIE